MTARQHPLHQDSPAHALSHRSGDAAGAISAGADIFSL
jgi:hypothetical protein